MALGGSGWKSSQGYPVNTGVPQGSILGPTHFPLYINDPPHQLICDIAIYADDTTLYKSTICLCVEHCCQVWASAPSCYLELLDNFWSFTCYLS